MDCVPNDAEVGARARLRTEPLSSVILILDRHLSWHFVRTCRRASCHFVNSAPSWDCSGISADGAPQGSTVSPFLRQFTKLPLLNLQDAPSLAFFLTQSRLRSRRVIPVLQRVLISLRRAARFPAVHPTAAVFHRCRSARLSTPLRSSPAARAQMHREFALHGVEHLSRGSVWGWISPEP